MKKVISLFLTVVMTFSMFSCLSVMVGAATTDLVVDREYTVPSDTTKIFVPEESGYYKFTSNGYGDPKITLEWSDNNLSFDDENGRDFNGIVELEAGEEVNCYLYNFQGEDCVFTITKVVVPESVSVDFVEPIEIVENTNGYWNSAEIWNEESEEYEYVDFFVYNVPFRYYEGNTITLNYADGTNDVYTCNGMEYFNSSGDVLVFDKYSDQSYENRWTMGADNYFIINVMGVETKVSVTIIEDPVKSIEFTPIKPYELIENSDGYFEDYYNSETEQWETRYFYNYRDIYRNGNIITINYTDGTSSDYVYSSDEDEWFDANGKKLDDGEPACYDYQGVEPWTIGGKNYFVVEYSGKKTQVPVTIIENPVESIEFFPAEPYEIMENTEGYYEDWYNPETEEWENTYFYDSYYISGEGNVLRVNYTDGRTIDYTNGYLYDEENDSYNFGWYNDEGSELPYDYVRSYDYQSVKPWKVGSDNYIVVSYLGKETQVPVTIFENPVESISVTLASPFELMENCDGYETCESIWDEALGENIRFEYFRYYQPSIYSEGNNIIINFKDGTSEVYAYDDWYCEFVNEDGQSLEFEIDSDQSYHNQWSLGSDNYMTILVYKYNKEGRIPVTIIENPYESIEFIPVEPLVIEEYTHGYWAIADEVEEEYEGFCYRASDVVDKEGNVIKLTKKDGTTEIYTYSDYNYVDENGAYLDYSVSSNSSEWGVGEANNVTISAKGVTSEYNVTIVENTSIVFEGVFIAEKISDDSCVLTRINVDDSFDGNLDIPEEIGGCKVIGIEDGALGRIDELKEINLPSSFGMVSEYLFEDCYCLEKINVSEDNAIFESVNGVLYNEALTEIIYCPEAFNGDLIIKAGVTEFPGNLIYRLGNAASIEIEEGNTVFAFEDGVLYDAEFKKIYIAVSPDVDFEMKSTVTEISDFAFQGNDTIESVKFAPGVTEIAYYSFANCSALKSIELPSSLVSIEEKAFIGDDSLSSLTLPASTKEVGSQAFSYCTSLAEINLNEGLESLGSDVFDNSAIEKIVLPDSLTSMGSGCFCYNKKLSDVIIGKGLTSIPDYTFYECEKIPSIDIPENITVLGAYSFGDTALSSVYLHDKITLADYAFVRCDNLEYAYIGSGIQSMKDAFSGCDKLAEIDFAEDFNGEMDFAFQGCNSLEEVEFPSTVTEIGYAAFYNCENLTSIDIPETLYDVESIAFDKTAWLENQADGNVYLEHILYVYKGAMPENYTLTVSEEAKSIAGSAFEKQKNLTNVEIPYGLKYICDYAFDGCSGLKSITIPGSVKHIGEYSLGYAYNNGRNIVKYNDFVIYGVKGSAAETYASENGFTFIEIEDEHKHTLTDWIIDSDATCTVAGSKYKACTVCGETVETDVIPAKGHKEVKVAAVAATCTETGLTEGSHCSVCNAVIKAQETVPAKGHTEVKNAAVAATCTTAGKTEGSHCSVCNAVIKAQETVPAKGHTEVKDAAIAATCTATGKTEGSHCSVCNAVIKAQEIVEAKGHTAGSWKTDKKATVYSAGKKIKKCTVCGKTIETATIKQLVCSKPKLKTIENTEYGVKITWGKVSGADKYDVYRKTGSSGKYTKIGTTSKTYYTDKKASSGKKCYYIVKAVNEAGSSSSSSSKSILYLADTTLSTPKSTKSGITLKWKKVTGADGYMVYRKTGSGSYSKIATVKGNSKVTYTDKKAKKGKTYTYKIKAYKSKTYSAYSNAKKIKDKY